MKEGEGIWTQPVSQSVSHLHAFKLEEWELWMAVNQAEEITGTDDLRYPPNASLIVSHRFSTYPLGCHLIIHYHHYPLLLHSPQDMAIMNHYLIPLSFSTSLLIILQRQRSRNRTLLFDSVTDPVKYQHRHISHIMST